jgi:hypothetical protein
MKRNVTIHELKCWPNAFAAIWDGRKTAEFRRDDRGFGIGDVLRLREYEPEGFNGAAHYAGREVRVVVTDIRRPGPFGIPEGYVMMSFRTIERLEG